ncbi:MAG TPA: response regulator [Polyangia bacterium]|nr:response regulator [Polyangia bacterium]
MSLAAVPEPGFILVVDDNVALAENIAEILTEAGHPAIVAVSAEAALERIRQGGVIAAVTDYRLPGLSGAEFIAALRREGIVIPVVVMSAYTDAAVVERAELSGALDVMPKPVDIARLMRMVAIFGGRADVLVVDDNQALAENLAEAFRSIGLTPVVGLSARQALSPGMRPRAALIDFRLPDSNGLELAKRLRARDPSIQIRLVSAYLDEFLSAAAQALPDVQCLKKPVDLDEVLRWAEAAVTGSRA